jgi:hypothetical protein
VIIANSPATKRGRQGGGLLQLPSRICINKSANLWLTLTHRALMVLSDAGGFAPQNKAGDMPGFF